MLRHPPLNIDKERNEFPSGLIVHIFKVFVNRLENKEPRFRGSLSHKILWLPGCVAGLLAVSYVPELSVLEDALHLDCSTPSAGKDLSTFTACVL